MQFAFEAVSLSKIFRTWWSRREVHALQQVDLAVAPGTVFGLLGPNGAGKTTLIKIALTVARADGGEVRLLGESIRNRSILRRVGYLPENPRFPMHLNAIQVLRLYGSLSGGDPNRIRENAEQWLERLELARWRDTRVSKFSKGMNERLAFAQALVHDPDLIFLDEPTDGLDPLGRKEVRTICRELADAGKTVFVNSHILAEIELICDRIAVMKSGEIIEQGTVADITSSRGGYELVVPGSEGLSQWLREKTLTFAAVNGHFRIQLPDRASANGLIDALRERNVEIESLMLKKKSLESVFMERIAAP
ncbi:MAG: ABC transporter ATP-binding protein [Acidobacteria bacterium]|nr:MAG: ABC transporter ATP-binding protein [Acidobacteriota bacterium]